VVTPAACGGRQAGTTGVYDDNFFSLLPGESRTVRIRFSDRAADMNGVRLLVDGWNVEPKAFLASGPGVAKNQNEHRASQRIEQ